MSSQRRRTTDGNRHEERIKNDAFIAPFGAIGYKFRKHFEGYGWFDGEVVEIRPGADRRVQYLDGDIEDLSLEELRDFPPLLLRRTKRTKSNNSSYDIAVSAALRKTKQEENNPESDATTIYSDNNITERPSPNRRGRPHENISGTKMKYSLKSKVAAKLAPKQTRSDATTTITAKNDTVVESTPTPKSNGRPPNNNSHGDNANSLEKISIEETALPRTRRHTQNVKETFTTTVTARSTNGDTFVADYIPPPNRRGRSPSNNPCRDTTISTEKAVSETSKRTRLAKRNLVPNATTPIINNISSNSNTSPKRRVRPAKDDPGRTKRARVLEQGKDPIMTTAITKLVSEHEPPPKRRHRLVKDKPSKDTTSPSEKPGLVREASPQKGISKNVLDPDATAQNDTPNTELKPSPKREGRSAKADPDRGFTTRPSENTNLVKGGQPRTSPTKMDPESSKTTINNTMTKFGPLPNRRTRVAKGDSGKDVANTFDKEMSIASQQSRISRKDTELDAAISRISTLESRLSPKAAWRRETRRANNDSKPVATTKKPSTVLESKPSSRRRRLPAKDGTSRGIETTSELARSGATRIAEKYTDAESVAKERLEGIPDSKRSLRLTRQPAEDESGNDRENSSELEVVYVATPRTRSAKNDKGPKATTTDHNIRDSLSVAKRREKSLEAYSDNHIMNASEKLDGSSFCETNSKQEQSSVPSVNTCVKTSCTAPLPTRKSRRDVKPTRKLEEYYLHQAAMVSTSRWKRLLKTEDLPPEVKRKKLLQSSLGVPIDKAAESTLQKTNQQIMKDEFEQMQEDNEQGWFVKVATYLSADASGPRTKRGLASRSSLKDSIIDGKINGSSSRSSFNDMVNSDAVSACSTISCSSDIDGTKSSSHRTNNNTRTGEEIILKNPPEAVLVSHPPPPLEAVASAPTLFRLLSDFKPGTRFGKKVFRKDDKQRIVIFERSGGWVEVNVGGHLENMRSGHLIVVPTDRFGEGDCVPETYMTASEVDQTEYTLVDLDKKQTAKRRSCDDSESNVVVTKRDVVSPSSNKRVVEPDVDIDFLFYWQCEKCEYVNRFYDDSCRSCEQKRTSKSLRSPLLEIAELAIVGENNVEAAMKKIPASDRQSIPEMIVSVLIDPLLRDFCVKPSSDVETYFYWICGSCTMQNSFKKSKCAACLKDKNQDYDRSTLFRIAEDAAIQSKTTKEAYSRVLEHERRSIPKVVMEALVTCIATVADGRKGDRRCRRAKLPGYDYCATHCDPLLLTAHTPQLMGDAQAPVSQPPAVRGIAAIIANMPSFLKSKFSTLLSKGPEHRIDCIEDSVLLDESKPFPLGLKVRKFFTGYGFHDGQIVKVCRKFVVLNEGSAEVKRPVLVYRVVYNDGDREDLIRNEITSLCQVYNRNVPAESPPHEQIPPGTIFEMISGSAIKVLEHTTPPEIANRNEGGTVIVSFDDSPHRMDIDLLKLQMSVVRKIGTISNGRNTAAFAKSKLLSELNKESSTSSDRFASVLEWPGPENNTSPNDQDPNDDSSACVEDRQSVCRGLTLRRTSNITQEQCESKLPRSVAVDNPLDARPGVINRGMWDPANGFPFLSWDPYLTVTCEICNVDKDDHLVVICDKCHSGYHTYCVRPVMVVVPKDDWLCAKCSTGQPNAIPFGEFAAKTTITDVEKYMHLPVLHPEVIVSSHNAFRYTKSDWRIPAPIMSKQEYDKSLISFVAAMHFVGMTSYSEELLYPEDKSAKKEMNDSALDVDTIRPLSKRNAEIFRAFKNNLKAGAFPPIKVVHDEHFGFSVEAMVVMPPHTLIAEYVGEVVTMEQSDEIRSDSLMVLLNTGKRESSLIIDPTRGGNIARFLSGINNRSLVSRRKANVRSLRFDLDGHVRVALFTSRRVEPGEKLQYDYNAGVKGKSLEELAESGFYDTSNFF